MTTGCECPICTLGHGIRQVRAAIDLIDVATDAQLDRSEECSMSLAYLGSEVKDIAKSWLAWPVRKRLNDALRIASPSKPTNNKMAAP